MRNIKFRAWDKKKNDWFDDDGALWVQLNGNIDFGWNGEIMDDYTDRIILMQYTGLKDKKGLEIYEGDIVRRTYLFDGAFGKTHIGEVVYDKESARYFISKPDKFIEPKTDDLGNTLSYRSTYEVIGNIYENQELVEDL